MKSNKSDYSKSKSIVLSGENMREVDSLIFSPLLLDRMSQKVRGKRSKMVHWAVKELARAERRDKRTTDIFGILIN